MAETNILLEGWSPLCNIQAFVEENGAAVYFYLWVNPGTETQEVRSCWVCNTAPGMEEMDLAAMQSGEAPRMPLTHVSHDPEGMTLDAGQLSIVWFEEGDAAALLEGGQIIAVIPGWAGAQFPGYSRYARGQNSLAWELTPALPVLEERTERSRAYWEAMEGNYFEELQVQQLEAIEAFFGPYRQYFSIDGGEFPPRALVTGERDKNLYAFTLGNAALAQPQVEQYCQEETFRYRRFELGVAFPPGTEPDSAMAMFRYMAAQVSLPWKEIGWLGHGHTVPCDAAPGYEAVMLVNPAHCEAQAGPVYPEFMGEPVNLLWLLLLTGEEYQQAMEDGADALLARKGADPAGWNLV